MPFVESAPHILEMLQWLNQKDPGNAYVGNILSLCRKYASSVGSVAQPSVSLSPRETELLALMAEGLNRRQIAEHLCITEETAKSHMKNIYQKLEVNSKVAAIKIAQNRGYLAKCRIK
jgi:LuxR family maltose regulon positive regulatory protein